jgi:hypothetical protein
MSHSGRGATGMPLLMRVGLLVLALGGGADLLHHALPTAPGLIPYLGQDGAGAHALTFAGMVVTMLGLFSRRFASADRPAEPAAIQTREQLRRTEHAHR